MHLSARTWRISVASAGMAADAAMERMLRTLIIVGVRYIILDSVQGFVVQVEE